MKGRDFVQRHRWLGALGFACLFALSVRLVPDVMAEGVSPQYSMAAEAHRIDLTDAIAGSQPNAGLGPNSSIEAIFGAVFRALPDDVAIRPTGNYLYFAFRRRGQVWRGNFRLDAADRDAGNIHFAVAVEGAPVRHRAFGAGDGVRVKQAAPLVYVVHMDGKAVVFRLNDLAATVPRVTMMRAGETLLGPVEDESGIGFFLLRDDLSGALFHVLDEARAGEPLERISGSEQIRIGARSGFAYYPDRYLRRWILIGVRAAEVDANGPFDGPFDQFPENFLSGDALRDAFATLDPDVAGQIDRFGNSPDLTRRVLARSYILYGQPEELAAFDQCAARAAGQAAFYGCLFGTASKDTGQRRVRP